MIEGSTSRDGGNSPITANDVQATRIPVTEAQLAVHTIDILSDRIAYEASQRVLA